MKKTSRVMAMFALFISLGVCTMPDESKKETTEALTAESILEQYENAIGGREAIEKLTSRVCTGKEIADFSSRKPPSYRSLNLKVHASTPMNYLIEKWSDDERHREGFDGKTGWTEGESGVKVRQRAGQGKMAFLLNPHGSLHIETYFPGLEYTGQSVVGGTQVYVLKPDSSLPFEHYTLYFSTESDLLVAIGLYWTIEDYRDVDGVMFPHRIARNRKGGSTVVEIETVTHNQEFSDSLFVMPE